jgi:hypothetical protein
MPMPPTSSFGRGKIGAHDALGGIEPFLIAVSAGALADGRQVIALAVGRATFVFELQIF